jgi:hypothetical protein
MHDLPDRHDYALALLDRARAAGLRLRNERAGLTATPSAKLDADMRAALSAAYYEVRCAIRAEQIAGRAIRRARRPAECVGSPA